MKKALLFVTIAVISATLFGFVFIKVSEKAIEKGSNEDEPKLKTGDIIFQGNNYGQSRAVKLATHSKYSHVGLVFEKRNSLYVFEAVQPVKVTPLDEWISHGAESKYEVLRLKEPIDFTEHQVSFDSIKTAWLGKDYDLLFEWSDEELYCSELVWKIYNEVYGIKLCDTKQLKDFDLSHPYVKAILKERYGNSIPLEQSVVAPQDVYDSKLLMKVHPL